VRAALRAGALVVAGSVALYSLVFGVRLAQGAQRMGFGGHRYCARAAAWVRREVPPGDVLLTQNPWAVSWATDRPAVLAPVGRRVQLARVARHYGVRWVLSVPSLGASNLERILGRRNAMLNAERVFGAQGCSVYRLDILTPRRGQRRQPH
jgi:hypothetical protein